MSGSLEGRVGLVTGAGAGIGKEIARKFAQNGAMVVLVDIDLGSAERAASEIAAEGGQCIAREV